MKSMDAHTEISALELSMSTAYQLEAIVRVLERKGLLTRDELLIEVKQIAEEQRKNQRPS
jgi:hypothetical protein